LRFVIHILNNLLFSRIIYAKMNIGNNIKQIRELNNFTQGYVADEIEVSQPTYSRIENGATPIKIETLQRIAEVLEVDLNTLLSTTKIFNFDKTANQCDFIQNQTNNNIDMDMLRKIIQEELKIIINLCRKK